MPKTTAIVSTQLASIASFVAFVIATVLSSAAQSNEDFNETTIQLPPLGNTAEMDRVLLREISDTHVRGLPLDPHLVPTHPKAELGAVNSSSVRLSLQSNQNINQSTNDNSLSLIETEEATSTHTSSVNSNIKEPTASLKKHSSIATETQSKVSQEQHATQPEQHSILKQHSTITARHLQNPDDIARYLIKTNNAAHSDNAWEVIRRSHRLPLKESERVKFYREQYKREAMWISKILHRGQPFLAHLIDSLEQRYMPVELALLPAIESGFLPQAVSAGNAAGLWQIVPITAKEIGIEQSEWFDGRTDIIKSTTAAVDYLSYLNAEFHGDWELTLAAYNAGPGRVRSAIRKNEREGLATDYWSLTLPEETLNYVPKMIALVQLIKSTNSAGLDLPFVPMEQAFEAIDLDTRVSLDRVAEVYGFDETMLKNLNAGLTHGITPPQGPHSLLIPAGTGHLIYEAGNNIDRNTLYAVQKTHKVESGDTISGIALKYGLTQKHLLKINELDTPNIKIGQELTVLDINHITDSELKYVVAIGDTLSEIAHRFSVSVSDITNVNGESLSDDIIHPGDTLNITVVNTDDS